MVAEEVGGEVARYRLLETLRQYGEERLRARGEVEAAHGRHAAHFLALVEEVKPHLTGHDEVAGLLWLQSERDNLRTALRWFLERGAAEEGMRLVLALHVFWFHGGGIVEGSTWLRRLLALPGAATSRLRTLALVQQGIFTFALDDTRRAHPLFAEALMLGRQSGDQPAIAWAELWQGYVYYFQGDYPQARPLMEESLALYRALDDRWYVSDALCRLGQVAVRLGDAASARAFLDEALAGARGAGDHFHETLATEVRGEVAAIEGDAERARALWEESLAGYRQMGDALGMATIEILRGYLALHLGDPGAARGHFEAGLDYLGERPAFWTIRALAGLAAVAAAGIQPERALHLAGAGVAHGESATVQLPPPEQAVLEGAMATARAALSEEAATAAWADGRAMSLAQAVEYAMGTRRADAHGQAIGGIR